MSTEQLIKKADIQKIATDGARIYASIKAQYDPKEVGKFLAIDTDTGKVYLGTTSTEAVELAKKDNPEKVFFLVKIGFDV